MKAWYPVHSLKNRVGIITDKYDEYVELMDIDTGNYVIVLFNQITPIYEMA